MWGGGGGWYIIWCHRIFNIAILYYFMFIKLMMFQFTAQIYLLFNELKIIDQIVCGPSTLKSKIRFPDYQATPTEKNI